MVHTALLRIDSQGDAVAVTLDSDLSGYHAESSCSPDLIDEARAVWNEALEEASVSGLGADQVRDLAVSLSAVALCGPIAESLQWLARNALESGNRLRLRIEARGDGASDLPWEYLCATRRRPTDLLDGFLGLQPGVLLSRAGDRAPSVRHGIEPLRVLIVAADPATAAFPRLVWLDAEMRSIEAAFDRGKSHQVVVRRLTDAVPATLERVIRDFRPHVFHFAGHAETRPSGGVFILQGADLGTVAVLRAEALGRMLAGAGTRLAMLSGCDTAGSPKSAAEVLAQAGVPAVIGLQAPLRDVVQPSFTRTFYQSLSEGAPVDEALAEARQANAAGSGHWGLPVLITNGEPETLTAAPPSTVTFDLPPSNLPRFERRLVGREEDRSRLRRMIMEEHRRLVSLVGLGGVGKTRLAHQVATELRPFFPDGVWFIACEVLTSVEELVASIGSLFDAESSVRTLDDLIALVARRRAALVLDCFDGLAAAGGGAMLELLLESAPRMVALVTARVGIGAEYAVRYRVQPLSLTTGMTVGRLDGESEGARLFLAAASDLKPDFSATREDIRLIEEMCSDLDGIPLALLLAAGRLRYVSLRELAQMIREDRERAVRDGWAPGIGGVIERSISLLPKGDVSYLRRICVFAGGFTWRDVSAVLEGDQYFHVDALQRLQDHSLVQSIYRNDVPRLRVLDTIREFVASMVQDNETAQDIARVRERHARHYCNVARLLAVSAQSGTGGGLTGALWEDLPNLRAAMSYASENAAYALTGDFVNALARALMEAGLWFDFERLAEAGYQASAALGDAKLSVQLLGLEGAMAARRGDLGRCARVWRRRADLCRESGDFLGCADSLVDLAVQAYGAKEYASARRLLDEAEPFLDGPDGGVLLATIDATRALVALAETELETAVHWAGRAERRASTLADTDPLLYVWTSLAQVWLGTNDLSRAENSFMDVILRARARDRRVHLGVALSGLAVVYERRGLLQRAATALAAANKLFDEVKSRRSQDASAAWRDFQLRYRHETVAHAFAEVEAASWSPLVDELLSFSELVR